MKEGNLHILFKWKLVFLENAWLVSLPLPADSL